MESSDCLNKTATTMSIIRRLPSQLGFWSSLCSIQCSNARALAHHLTISHAQMRFESYQLFRLNVLSCFYVISSSILLLLTEIFSFRSTFHWILFHSNFFLYEFKNQPSIYNPFFHFSCMILFLSNVLIEIILDNNYNG